MEKSQNQNISIVQVFPDPLVITQTGNSNYYESKLNLTNLTNEYVVFKIYNNQHALYSAKPSTSFIPPKETAYVSIKRFKKDEEQTKVGKDKFLLVFYTINKVINDNDEARDAIKSKLYNEYSKQNTVISIILKNKQELKNAKDIAMKNNKNVYKSEKKNLKKIILISIVLLVLLIGANLSLGFNKLFNQNPIQEKEFINYNKKK
jgi:hypothetical protein